MTATDKQLEYISILSDYESTKKEDKKDISAYLKSVGKSELKNLTKKEASELIQKLLSRPVIYRFLCGAEKKVHKKQANRFNLLGSFEACLHACPKEQDVHRCFYWLEYQDGKTASSRYKRENTKKKPI